MKSSLRRAWPVLALFPACCAVALGGATSFDLAVPQTRPDGQVLEVVHAGLHREITLERHSLRAPGFRVRAHAADRAPVEVQPQPPATYRGRVTGEPRAGVLAHLDSSGWHITVVGVERPDWRIRPLGGGLHEVTTVDLEEQRQIDCPEGLVHGSSGEVRGEPFASSMGAASAPASHGSQHLAQIAFDVDYQYYLLKGGSVQGSLDAVEAIMNQVDYFYARDLLVTYSITHIIVRTEQYYFPTGGGNLLDLFRAEWNTNQADVVRDMAHLMTNKSGIEFGGLAWVGAVCNSFAYGWSLDSANIVGHELGHNWGAGHCHDLAPCNNMCGACFYIAPTTKEIKTAYRDSLSCLDDAGAYADPLPPYAHPEGLELSRDELALLIEHPFDVLGNDHDGNLDPLSIDGFDAVTEEGGTVSLSPGSAPDGRDELIYAPPNHVFPGDDVFLYQVGDGTGLSESGQVTIDVPAERLVGYWKLDDAAGTVAADASNYDRHAETVGGPAWTLGRHSRALSFDGIDDAVLIPPLNIRRNRVTITAWVKRQGSQSAWAGIVFNRDGSTIAGLNFGTADELRYHWNGTGDTWGWNSGLVVPDDQWVLVALVVQPDRATIHLHDGTLQSATNPVQHAIEEFDGVTRLGHDASSSVRYFEGVLDDVRIYDHALAPADIEELAELGGKSVAPNPHDGGRFVPLVGKLSWLPGLEADSHDVYFGDDYVEVRDASTSSATFVGNQTHADLIVGTPEPGQVYAWRVDERVGDEVVEGAVWLYRRVESGGYWPLDEASGATAVDADGSNDGTYQNGVQQGQPGATPNTGLAARLDGVDDYVEIPPIDLNGDEITITGWVRRDGIQSSYAGIVFSRAGGTVAGISSLITGNLRYHWNNAHWDWESGLVLPHDSWAFFGLVVRPDMATVWLGQDGELSSASNAALHGVEEFDGPLDLGRDGAVGRYFRGWIDDVRVYRAALTARDIEAVYQAALQTAAGEVPDELVIGKGAGSELALSWPASCLATDQDYAVYEGGIGDFASHAPVTCSTGGMTDAAVVPGAGGRYFLVVPQSPAREGGYGVDGSGSPRSPGASACKPQQSAPCESTER